MATADARATAVGSLALGSITAPADTVAARALGWWRRLDALGVSLPLVVVHDLGLTLALPDRALTLAPRARLSGDDARLADGLQRVVRGAGETLVRRELTALGPRDDVVVAALAALLCRYDDGAPVGAAAAAALLAGADALRAAWDRADRDAVRRAVAAVIADAPALLTRLDALDVDTLRLSAAMGDDALTTLVSALERPHGGAISRMTLRVMPRVLEGARRRAARAAEHGGVEGLASRGELGSLLASELAWDDDELARRVLLDEAMYLTREAESRPEPRRHVLLVDATAAMRGDRAVFARALCLALAKRLRLAGDAVVIRLFDARLHEPIVVGAELPVAELVSFRAEGGRNVARVLDSLTRELERRGGQGERHVAVHLITHGATVAPRALVSRLVRAASLHVTRVGASTDDAPGWLELATSWSAVSMSDAADPRRGAARVVELIGGAARAPSAPAGAP